MMLGLSRIGEIDQSRQRVPWGDVVWP